MTVLAEPVIKVCGLSRQSDVQVAVRSGATAIGLVFHPPSPRYLDTEQAAALGKEMSPGVAVVGVFVDLHPDQVLSIAQEVGLTQVQLCGMESSQDWSSFPVPIWRRLPADETATSVMREWKGIAQCFVLDHPEAPGGTGLTVDWNQAQELCRQVPCLLAGGLEPRNVASAVRQTRPAGVDASSLLESKPGIKDPDLIRQFVSTAQSAFHAISLERDHDGN